MNLKPIPLQSAIAALFIVSANISVAATLPASEDSFGFRAKLTVAANKANQLPVDGTHKAYIYFNLGDLPDGASIRYARLRIYLPKVIRAGNGLTIHKVTGPWDESLASVEPASDPTAITTIQAADLTPKGFVSVDLTDVVRDWLTTPASNEGIAIAAVPNASNLLVASIQVGAKEGSGSGYPAELDVELEPAPVAEGAIGTTELATGAVESGNIANGAVGSLAIADGSIVTAKFANESVTTSKLELGSVGSAQLSENLTLGGTTTGTFNGNLIGNATTATSAATATIAGGFTGALSGDVTGTQGATVVSSVAGINAANVATGVNSANGATDANTAGAIVKRDSNGNFSAGSLTLNGGLAVTGSITGGAFSGDGSGLTGVNASSFAEAPTNVLPAFGMVWIKPGTFIMGSPANEQGRFGDEVQHAVTLTTGFWMGVHEVTQSEYQAVIGSNPSFYIGDTTRPVEQVSWNSAVAFCSALTTSERVSGRIPANWSYRLPTEAEWEYSCRAGARTTRFSFGDDLSAAALGNYAWYSASTSDITHSVGQKLGNPWGLMDMHGNVLEWCQEYYGAYPAGSATDPQGPVSGSLRAIRGGRFGLEADKCRSAMRGYGDPALAIGYLGFRVVLAPSQP